MFSYVHKCRIFIHATLRHILFLLLRVKLYMKVVSHRLEFS